MAMKTSFLDNCLWIFLTWIFLACADAHANASIAKIPETLRQTYNDGTYSEISCSKQPVQADSEGCYLRVKLDSKIEEYRFNIGSYGYADFIESYNFFEGKSPIDFSVSIEVSCRTEDLALIPMAKEDNTHCRLYLLPQGKELVPDVVNIVSVISGKTYRKARDLRKNRKTR